MALRALANADLADKWRRKRSFAPFIPFARHVR